MFGFSPIASEPLAANEDASATLVSSNLDASYSVSAPVRVDLPVAYVVDSVVVSVSADLSASYPIAAVIDNSLAAAYAIHAAVRADLAALYEVDQIVTYARAPSGSGYSPRCNKRSNRPPNIQGICS